METSDGSIVAPLAGDKKPNWLDESQTLHERYFGKLSNGVQVLYVSIVITFI